MTLEELGRRASDLSRWLASYERRRDSAAGADPSELLSIYRAYLDFKAEVWRDRAIGRDRA